MNQKKLPIRLPAAITLLLVASLVAACSAAPGTTQQSSSTNQATGQRITVTKGTISNLITATGKVVARATAQLSFSSSAPVKTVNVNVGDQVKAGQALASLDTTSLEFSARSAHASFIDAQAAYSLTIKPPSQADLEAAQAGVINAQEAYSTALKGATSAELGSASASVKSAQAALDALSIPPTAEDVASQLANLQNAEATLKQKQAAYDSAFQRNPAGIGGTSAGLDLEQATNNYNAAKAAYDKLFQKPTDSAIASAKAQVASAQANWANLAPTKEKIAAAQQALATAQSKLEALTPSDEAIAQSQAKLDQATTSWQQAEKAIQDATLKAPFDGMIAAVNVDPGDSSGTGTAIEVADFAVPQFEISVDEADMGGVKVGEDAMVLLQSYPNISIPAKVERVDAAGSTSGSIVTFNVFLSIGQAKTADDTQPTILLGMSGTSQVVTAQATDAIIIPNRALTVDSTTKAYSVQRVSPTGTVEKVQITVGFKGTDSVQALDGVNVGDILLVPTSTRTNSGGGFPGGGPGGGPGGN
jgi:HlyD family secretion protein